MWRVSSNPVRNDASPVKPAGTYCQPNDGTTGMVTPSNVHVVCSVSIQLAACRCTGLIIAE
ncbi:hypothetical protein PISMIDRAFT_670735 [Pisolithus microcarpus 441]|uniref:Uncharacterized protein n=1 Tax=Pisolithus microcarpus 441 TaxID=765257 RepID=A0A0D0A8A2_9AGAM|nr:hypothetical protein PISMIDRAFT_670735 [Pisolithus microcarpus 441]